MLMMLAMHMISVTKRHGWKALQVMASDNIWNTRFEGASPRINTIIVANGYVKSQAAWENNSRVKKLKVYLDNKPLFILNLEDKRATQTFNIDPIGFSDRENDVARKKLAPWKLKFEILEVYKGLKYDDVAISEIYFDGLDVHCLAKATKITMSDGTLKNIEAIVAGDEVMTLIESSGERSLHA